MRLHPFMVAAVLGLAAATAWSASLINGHGSARERRVAVPPPPPDEAPPPPRPGVIAPPRPVRPPPVEAPPPPSAVLRVRVIGPHGLVFPDADVSAVRQGDEEARPVAFEESDEEDAAPGTLVATELEVGRYDLTVEAPGMRPTHLGGLSTGGKLVTIALARKPILFGAVGAPGRLGCAGGRLLVRGPEDAEGARATSEGPLRDDCSFSLEDLPEQGPLTVELRWGEAEPPVARALVTLPAAEDPVFLCLSGPCPTAAAAPSLIVYVADPTGRLAGEAALEWTLVGDDTRGEVGSTTGGGMTTLDGRRAGEALRLVATDDDGRAETTVVVGPGVNEVVLTLSRPRRPPP